MKTRRTERGFNIANFTDRYGVSCSIQESSLATEACIWLGCDDANPQMFVPNGKPTAWRPLPLPELPPGGDFSFNTRMHLSQDQVAELIPLLQHFVDTGELP